LQQVNTSAGLPSTDQVACVAGAVDAIFSSLLGEAPVQTGEEVMNQVLRCDGVIGIISLVGDVDWLLVLGLPRDTAPAIAEGFAGFPIPFESEDMADAVGELANLVAGDVKVNLDAIRLSSEISLPQVLRGTGIEVLRPPRTPSVVLTFDSSCGPFLLALTSRQS